MFTKTPKNKMTWGQFEAERKLPKNHFLIRINELIDFSPMEKALRELTQRTRAGQLILLWFCSRYACFRGSTTSLMSRLWSRSDTTSFS